MLLLIIEFSDSQTVLNSALGYLTSDNETLLEETLNLVIIVMLKAKNIEWFNSEVIIKTVARLLSSSQRIHFVAKEALFTLINKSEKKEDKL